MNEIEAVLSKIKDAQTRRALWDVVTTYYHDQGIKMISYHAVRAGGGLENIATVGFPEDWVCRYIEEDLVKIDPIPELAANLAHPFFWHEIEELATLSKSNARYLEAMKEAQLGDGLAFCVFGPRLRNAYVGLGFGQPHVTLPEGKVFEFQCVAQTAHLRYCDMDRDGQKLPDLSRREQDVLEWMAHGKSNSVIAEILGMSPHTVDSHVRNIYRKLGVSDRTSAALRGLGHGLITLT